MKYSTTISILLFLSFILILLLSYFGKLTRQLEKDIEFSLSEINNLKELIRVNELEFVAHTNTNYLLKLKSIYLADNNEGEPVFNYINLNDFKKKNINQILKINLN